MPKIAWAHRYRPKSVKDFIFTDKSAKALVHKFINDGNIPDLLLSGHHGTGKSSLVQVLRHELKVDDLDYLYINASLQTSVDTVRSKVFNFVNTYAMGDFKIVYLDEFDRMSKSAQDSLKSLIEEYAENARFILTCNNPSKIVPALKSRCQELVFKELDKNEMFNRALDILEAEGVRISTTADEELVDKYINETYPDFRKLLNTLEQRSIDGVLTDGPSVLKTEDEASFEIIGLIADGNWDNVRKFAAANTQDGQWDELYRMLYDYIDDISSLSSQTKKAEAIVTIADHLYKHAIVADPEINFAACVIKLSRISTRKE